MLTRSDIVLANLVAFQFVEKELDEETAIWSLMSYGIEERDAQEFLEGYVIDGRRRRKPVVDKLHAF